MARRFISLCVFLQLFLSAGVIACAEPLDVLNESIVKSLLKTAPGLEGENVYFMIKRLSDDGESFPFYDALKASVISTLSRLNIKADQSPASFKSGFTMMVSYQVDEDVTVNINVSRFLDHEFVTVASGSQRLKRWQLSQHLFSKDIDDLVKELAHSLSSGVPLSHVKFVSQEMTEEGSTNSSEFGHVLLNQLKNTLIKEYQWRTVTDTTPASTLSGQYKVGKKFVTVTVDLLPEGISASAQSSKADLSSYSLHPANPGMLPAFEVPEDFLQKDESFKARIFTNKEDQANIYYRGDKLEISFVPLEDSYIWLYYVQVDGAVVQLYPNAYSGAPEKFEAGFTYTFPGADDNYTLIITDATLGQEAIIVYLCNQQIPGIAISKSLISDLGLYKIDMDINNVQLALTRGLSRSFSAEREEAKYNILIKNIIVKEGTN